MAIYKAIRTSTGQLKNRFTGTQYKTIRENKAVRGTYYASYTTNTQGRPSFVPAKFVDIQGYVFDGNDFQLLNEQASSFAGVNGIGKWHLVGHSLGIAGGIYYSFMKKTGFWKGLGITIIVGIAGGALGMAVDYATKNQNQAK